MDYKNILENLILIEYNTNSTTSLEKLKTKHHYFFDDDRNDKELELLFESIYYKIFNIHQTQSLIYKLSDYDKTILENISNIITIVFDKFLPNYQNENENQNIIFISGTLKKIFKNYIRNNYVEHDNIDIIINKFNSLYVLDEVNISELQKNIYNIINELVSNTQYEFFKFIFKLNTYDNQNNIQAANVNKLLEYQITLLNVFKYFKYVMVLIYNKISFSCDSNVLNFESRDYQKKYIENSANYLNNDVNKQKGYNKCLIDSPTGSGKTFMSYNILDEVIESKLGYGNNILLVSPRLDINEQIVDFKYLNNLYNFYDHEDSSNTKNFINSEYIIIHFNSLYPKDLCNSILNFCTENNMNVIISTTYESLNKVIIKSIEYDIKYSVGLFDESHCIAKDLVIQLTNYYYTYLKDYTQEQINNYTLSNFTTIDNEENLKQLLSLKSLLPSIVLSSSLNDYIENTNDSSDGLSSGSSNDSFSDCSSISSKVSNYKNSRININSTNHKKKIKVDGKTNSNTKKVKDLKNKISDSKLQQILNKCYLFFGNLCKKQIFLSATPYDDQSLNMCLFGKSFKYTKVGRLIANGDLAQIKPYICNLSDKDNSRKNNAYDLEQDFKISLLKPICNGILNFVKDEKINKGVVFFNTNSKIVKALDILNNLLKSDTFKNYFDDNLKFKVFTYYGKDKKKVIKEFCKYKYPAIVLSCKKINMGFDDPRIDSVIFADKRLSKIDISQCIGRGLRKYFDKICKVLLFETNNNKMVFNYLNYMQDECEYNITRKMIETNKTKRDKKNNESGQIEELEIDGDSMFVDIELVEKYTVYRKGKYGNSVLENIDNKYGENIFIGDEIFKNKLPHAKPIEIKYESDIINEKTNKKHLGWNPFFVYIITNLIEKNIDNKKKILDTNIKNVKDGDVKKHYKYYDLCDISICNIDIQTFFKYIKLLLDIKNINVFIKMNIRLEKDKYKEIYYYISDRCYKYYNPDIITNIIPDRNITSVDTNLLSLSKAKYSNDPYIFKNLKNIFSKLNLLDSNYNILLDKTFTTCEFDNLVDEYNEYSKNDIDKLTKEFNLKQINGNGIKFNTRKMKEFVNYMLKENFNYFIDTINVEQIKKRKIRVYQLTKCVNINNNNTDNNNSNIAQNVNTDILDNSNITNKLKYDKERFSNLKLEEQHIHDYLKYLQIGKKYTLDKYKFSEFSDDYEILIKTDDYDLIILEHCDLFQGSEKHITKKINYNSEILELNKCISGNKKHSNTEYTLNDMINICKESEMFGFVKDSKYSYYIRNKTSKELLKKYYQTYITGTKEKELNCSINTFVIIPK
jgi:superfamily II DNA or RNA helicase